MNMLATAAARSRSSCANLSQRSLSTYVGRVPQRRDNEAGPGGRASDADVKVAIFGAGGFLGRYVCCQLGRFTCFV